MIQEKPERRTASPERFLLDLRAELPQRTLQDRWQHVNTVLRIGMMSGLQMQLGATLSLLCDACAEITPFRTGLAYFWDAKSESSLLRLVCDKASDKAGDKSGDQAGNQSCAHPGRPSAKPDHVKERLGDANILDLWCRIHRKPLRVPRGHHHEVDHILDVTGGEVVLALPLFVNGRVMGSLQLVAADPAALTDEDAQLLWVLVHVAENLLTREHANESLMLFAFTDHLTGLRTRGYFEQQLELEIKRSERKQEAFALLMLDIDHFKRLNDTYGHGIGDQVLREVAAVLTQDMREVDTVARYGGEEFVIILPEATEAEGAAVAERIRNAVAQEVFLRDAKLEIAPLRLTVSIGLCTFPHDGRDRRELVEFSDAALYAAKAGGRNCVMPYSRLKAPQSKAV